MLESVAGFLRLQLFPHPRGDPLSMVVAFPRIGAQALGPFKGCMDVPLLGVAQTVQFGTGNRDGYRQAWPGSY